MSKKDRLCDHSFLWGGGEFTQPNLHFFWHVCYLYIHNDLSRRSYSNIDMTTRPSLKRQKSNNNNDGIAVAKRTKEEGTEAMTNSEED